MADPATPDAAPARAWPVSRPVAIGAFAAVCIALVLAYYLFLRTDYAVLYAGLKPADASAIVTQLDAKGIPHRLRDDGTTILVPTDQADNVRLAVAGSDIPMKGSVGFELFNKSDIGLTDFAQKINYQRALQGEIARTIMMMEGIETARVHLAIPERSLFRGNRSSPKAAIEIIAKLGLPLTPDRVAGIQQLVASAIPDLALDDVSILDGDGRLISAAASAPQASELTEQAAAQQYFSARAKNALALAMPGAAVGVRTLILQGSVTGTPPTADAARDFQLRITILTPQPMSRSDQEVARTAVAQAVGLNEKRGDTIAVEVGPVEVPPPVAARAMPVAVPSAPPPTFSASEPAPWSGVGVIGVIAALAAAVGVALVIMRGQRAELSVEERDAFVARLREGLANDGSETAHV